MKADGWIDFKPDQAKTIGNKTKWKKYLDNSDSWGENENILSVLTI